MVFMDPPCLQVVKKGVKCHILASQNSLFLCLYLGWDVVFMFEMSSWNFVLIPAGKGYVPEMGNRAINGSEHVALSLKKSDGPTFPTY